LRVCRRSIAPISELLASSVHEFAIADAAARPRPRRALSPSTHSFNEHLWSFHTLTTSVALAHSEERLAARTLEAMNKCSLFQENPALSAAQYRVRSSVIVSTLREFISELEGKAVKITDTNLTGLQPLREAFGFDEFAAKVQDLTPDQRRTPSRSLRWSLIGTASGNATVSSDRCKRKNQAPCHLSGLHVISHAMFFVSVPYDMSPF
jgi:hypothetical protein